MATQHPEGGRQAAIREPVVEALDETECLSLIAGGGVGPDRIHRPVRAGGAAGQL